MLGTRIDGTGQVGLGKEAWILGAYGMTIGSSAVVLAGVTTQKADLSWGHHVLPAEPSVSVRMFWLWVTQSD